MAVANLTAVCRAARHFCASPAVAVSELRITKIGSTTLKVTTAKCPSSVHTVAFGNLSLLPKWGHTGLSVPVSFALSPGRASTA